MSQVYRCIVLVLCVSAVLAELEPTTGDDLRKLYANLRQTCVAETGAEIADVVKLSAGQFKDNNDKLECYALCVLASSHSFNKNGEINYEALGQILPEPVREKVKNNIKNCEKEAEGITNPCKKAYTLIKCGYKMDPAIYYFP